jgi:beta-glucosidase
MVRLKQDGVPILGFTWFSLTDHLDRDTALRDDAGWVNALGLYDLARQIRPVRRLYRDLARQWGQLLSTGEHGACPRPLKSPVGHDRPSVRGLRSVSNGVVHASRVTARPGGTGERSGRCPIPPAGASRDGKREQGGSDDEQ